MRRLRRQVAATQRTLHAIYDLDLELAAEQYLVAPEAARRLLPDPSPRSGVIAVEADDELHLGLYLDPRDQQDLDSIVEETSHLVCLAWHAAHGRRVSRLILELQGEVDRYAVARLSGRDALGHFRDFAWDGWMDAATRARYETAHRVAERYCRALSRLFPRQAQVPGLLASLRRFYRAAPEVKLRAA